MHKDWNLDFTPSYTPEDMLRLGVFEGKYINNIKGIPAHWKTLPKVVGPKEEPNIELNSFAVKSRQPLSVWKEKGWITKNDPNGWFEWYIHYWQGRRLGEEDNMQIGRWKSFVARHQGQIKANCTLKDLTCRPIQRQALLQWAWDSTTNFTEEQREKNLKLFTKETVAQEGLNIKETPAFLKW
jgi:hypothetical protein